MPSDTRLSANNTPEVTHSIIYTDIIILSKCTLLKCTKWNDFLKDKNLIFAHMTVACLYKMTGLLTCCNIIKLNNNTLHGAFYSSQ